MEPLSLSPLAQRSKLIPLVRCSLFGNSLRRRHHRLPPQSLAPSPGKLGHSIRRAIAKSSSVADLQQVQKENTILETYPNWDEFASRVSGEWDGFGAEFSSSGEPIELPENVVPEAFREWEVKVFDWQTQCPTLAETSSPSLLYKLIKLLPTVGCEADAATRHSMEEKTVEGSSKGTQSAFAYDRTGNYVAIWPKTEEPAIKSFEIEHCLRHPENHEVRIRIIQRITQEQRVLSVRKIDVFSEQWYGPFRNGEQLGGCSIRESGFASTAAMEGSRVLGAWERVSVGASFSNSSGNAMKELDGERREKLDRDEEGLVTLPKQLWSAVGKDDDDDERWVEVGWMLDHGHAITSRCMFTKDGDLKEIAVGHEAVIPDVTSSS